MTNDEKIHMLKERINSTMKELQAEMGGKLEIIVWKSHLTNRFEVEVKSVISTEGEK